MVASARLLASSTARPTARQPPVNDRQIDDMARPASRSSGTVRRIIVVALSALAVAGCSSADDDAAPDTTSSTTIHATPSEETSPDSATAASAPTTAPAATPATTALPATTAPSVGRALAGATTLEDPYVGSFGNGGYDVRHYDLTLGWDPDERRLDGIAIISATATQNLSAFNLELTGLTVSEVTVDGERATFAHDESELNIAPVRPVAEGADFDVQIDYGGTPIDSRFDPGAAASPSGWHTRDGYAYVAGEPLAASTFHPANDHPSDKASFTYRITAPSDLTVGASGTLTDRSDHGDTTTWTFSQPDPQATYLTTILIGDFVILDGGTSASGVPVRNVIDSEMVDNVDDVFDTQPEMIDAFEPLFGPYPFDVYGAAVVRDPSGIALETQTLSIFGADLIEFPGIESIVAHELAHQRFGNHVSLDHWSDIWLNEGFATYAEALWEEAVDPNFSYDEWVGDLLLAGSVLDKPPLDPGAFNLFGPTVYLRGALTLHALRVEVGDATFFDILRAWVERFGGANATTADFQALAAELSGADLDDLFDAWLRADTLPSTLGGVEGISHRARADDSPSTGGRD